MGNSSEGTAIQWYVNYKFTIYRQWNIINYIITDFN